jgi:hypothetical protein
MRRAADVDGRCILRMLFREIDVRPRGSVQDEVGSLETRRRRELDIPVLACKGDRVRELLGERTTELAARAGDQDPLSRSERIGDGVLQRSRTRGSSQGMPCSSGSAGSYSSVTW